MKLRIAIATFAALSICSVVTTRMSALTPETLPSMLFGGSGPVPCPSIGCLRDTSGVSQSTTETNPAMFLGGGGVPPPCPPSQLGCPGGTSVPEGTSATTGLPQQKQK
jgi:hypothetical protein